MSVITSVLNKVVKTLPEDFSMKSQSVAPMLLKKGVKPEELVWSGLDMVDGKVTKRDLVDSEAARKDQFEVVEGKGDYINYNVPEGRSNPTYREKVLTFKDDKPPVVDANRKNLLEQLNAAVQDDDGYDIERLANALNIPQEADIEDWLTRELSVSDTVSEKSRYTSSHFPEIPNYLAHTRVFDQTMDGKPTRVLLEIQSDLHQQARQTGGYAGERAYTEEDLADIHSMLIDGRNEEAVAKLQSYGITIPGDIDVVARPEDIGATTNLVDFIYDLGYSSVRIPTSPQEKTWLVKGIERELVDAVNEGREQLAIPISGSMVQGMARGQGPQKWYETQVVDTAKKVAKRADADFELVSKSLSGNTITLDSMTKAYDGYISHVKAKLLPGYKVRDRVQVRENIANNLVKNSGIDSKVASEIADSIMDTGVASGEDLYKALMNTQQLNTYAIIKPKAQYTTVEEAMSSMSAAETKSNKLLDEISTIAKDYPTVKFNGTYEDLSRLEREARWPTLGEPNPELVSKIEELDKLRLTKDKLERGLATDKDSYRKTMDSMLEESDKLLAEINKKFPRNSGPMDYREVRDLGEFVSSEIPEIGKYLKLMKKQNSLREIYQGSDGYKALEHSEYMTAKIDNIYSLTEDVKGFENIDFNDVVDIDEVSRALDSADVDDALRSDIQKEIADYKKSEAELSKLDTTEGKIKTGVKGVEFNLYSSPAAAAFAAYTGYKTLGSTDEEIKEVLKSKGKDEEEIDRIMKVKSVIDEAAKLGYSESEIKAVLDKKYKPAVTEAKEIPESFKIEAYQRWAKGNGLSPKNKSLESILTKEAETAKELLINMQTLKPTLTSNLFTDLPTYFGNQEAASRHRAAAEKSRAEIMRMMYNKYNIELSWDYKSERVEGWDFINLKVEGWRFINKQGEVEIITPGFWDDLAAETGEIIGGTAGSIAAFNAAPPSAPVVGPFSKPIAGIVGGLVGSVVGSELDYLKSAVEIQSDLEFEAMAHTAFNASEMAIIGEAIGYAAVKSLGTGWKYLIEAKDLLIDGNTSGAYRALKETSNYTDEQLTEIVTRLEKVMTVPGKDSQEKAMSAVALTESGMEDLVRAAGSVDPIAGKRVLDFIDKRAKSVLEATGDISTPNAAVRFVSDLSNYTGDVKALYNKVKVRATHSPNAQNFEFDYDAIAIDPILDELAVKILDPTVADRFLRQAQRIKTMTESRSFADLIELRQLTNDFLFNKNISKADDKRLLRGVVDQIDDMIEQGAEEVVENPQQWLEDWATAKSEYSKMKKMEKTAMYRLVFDKDGKVKPVTPESVTKAMTKYLTTLDGNFDALLDELPPKSRSIYEGAIIDTLANKYAIGYSTEKQAIHFPALAEDLSRLKFLSPAARATKDALLEMSEIFKNELPLALTNSSFKVPSFQSYLTTDPVVRAKFEVASGVFNYIKTLAPNQEQRANALIRKTSKLLEEPLNAKTANEIISEFGSNPEVLKMISQVQRDTAYAQARGLDISAAKVKIYEGGKFTGEGAPITTIGRHRIASVEVVQQIADSEAVSTSSKLLDGILKQYGYAAVENGTDRVRLLK